MEFYLHHLHRDQNVSLCNIYERVTSSLILTTTLDVQRTFFTTDSSIVDDRISYLGKAREKMHTSSFALLLDWSKALHLSSDWSKAITRMFEPNNKEKAKTKQTNSESIKKTLYDVNQGWSVYAKAFDSTKRQASRRS